MYTFICMYVYMSVYKCMPICKDICVHVCVYMYIHVCVYIYMRFNAFNIIMNSSYEEKLSFCLSSYPVRWQNLLVAPGVAFTPEPPKLWYHPWVVADENRVSHMFFCCMIKY